MKISRLLLLLLSVLCLNRGMVQADDKDALREKLDTAIVEGIRLLEAKEYATFLRHFVPPDMLKQLGDDKFDEFAKKFSEKKAGQLLAALKSVKNEKPKLDDDGTTATFDVKIEDAPRKTVVFKKIDKYWYISN